MEARSPRPDEVMQHIGMRYVGEVFSRGLVEGVGEEREDAPFAVCVALRRDRAKDPPEPP